MFAGKWELNENRAHKKSDRSGVERDSAWESKGYIGRDRAMFDCRVIESEV